MTRTFIIQNDSDARPEVDIITSTAFQYGMFHPNRLQFLRYSTFKDMLDDGGNYVDIIPIGTIPFINSWLTKYYNKTMFPIEVPKCLQSQKFLGRAYDIVSKDSIPKHGNYFVKGINQLKSGTFVGDMVRWWTVHSHDYEPNDLFILSNELNMLSEWRVYVVRGELLNISQYDGDPSIFPDINIIREAVHLCNNDNYVPKSYTLDVAVTPQGTVVLEVHPFTSVGLYTTLWDERLFDAYEDGINFYKNNDSWWK